MKIVVNNPNPINTINLSDVSCNAIIGAIATNGRKCLIHSRSDGKFSPVGIDLNETTIPTWWDSSVYSSIKDLLEKYKSVNVQCYVFDTQRELVEWLLK